MSININRLNYKKIHNLSINIKPKEWINVLGRGKTDFSYIIKNNNMVELINIDPNDIVIIPANSDDYFVSDKVINNILFRLSKYHIQLQEKRLQELVKYFQIENILNKNPHNLSRGEKQLINFVSYVIDKPKVLIADDCFNMLDNIMSKRIYSYIRNLCNEGMIFINLVSNKEDLLYGDKNIILGEETKVLTKEELYNTTLLRKIGYDLPFILDLSNKLKYYNVIDKIYLNISKLVNTLWK